MRTGVANAFRI